MGPQSPLTIACNKINRGAARVLHTAKLTRPIMQTKQHSCSMSCLSTARRHPRRSLASTLILSRINAAGKDERQRYDRP